MTSIKKITRHLNTSSLLSVTRALHFAIQGPSNLVLLLQSPTLHCLSVELIVAQTRMSTRKCKTAAAAAAALVAVAVAAAALKSFFCLELMTPRLRGYYIIIHCLCAPVFKASRLSDCWCSLTCIDFLHFVVGNCRRLSQCHSDCLDVSHKSR